MNDIDISSSHLLAKLLARPHIPVPDEELAGTFRQRVLITGGCGSIGSELALTIARSGPEALLLVDNSEVNLFRLESTISSRFPGLSLKPILGDVSREADVRNIFDNHSIDIVYHTAAYKHVNFAERYCVPILRTNIIGTDYVARAASDNSATFILLSTDKAEQPHGILGLSKGVAELIANSYSSIGARSFSVRSGNVIGSTGSFLEVIGNCLRHGAAVPVTDLLASRFYLTLAEITTLLLRALRVGESGWIYWVNLGPELSVRELLSRLNDWLLAASGKTLETTIVGLRPGERLREPVALWSEMPVASGIWKVKRSRIDRTDASSIVERLRLACDSYNTHDAVEIAREALSMQNGK